MTTPTQTSPFDTLASLGLITEAQRDTALRHPQRAELDDHPGEVDALVWLVVRDIVSEEQLADTSERLISRHTGEAFRERRALLDGALDKLRAVRTMFNQEAVGELLSKGLITQAQHDTALPLLPSEHSFALPAAAMAWLVLNDVLSSDEFKALHTRVLAQGGFATAQKRVEIMVQAHHILTKTGEGLHKAAVSAFWSGVFPGPRWMWLAGLALFVGGLIWYVVAPDSPPACDGSRTIKTVNSMLFSAHIRARGDVLRGGLDRPVGAPRLSDASEVGHARPDRIRGCIGKLDFNGEKTPYAYTIGPSGTQQGEFVITGADETLVQARFGHLDADGHYAHQAEPVGRAPVETAFRAGVEAMNQDASHAGLQRMLERSRRHAGGSVSRGAPAREREIAEIEPLAPCREVAAGTRYVCKLLIERNDPFLAAMGGGSSTLLQGEFSFERAATGQPWQVTADFAKEFAEAVVAGRIALLTGTEPAAESTPKP